MKSGKGGASLRRPPLRTVRANLSAHGSSKPLCTLGLPPPGMDLLVTVEVYEPQIARLFRIRFSPTLKVVYVQLFPVE